MKELARRYSIATASNAGRRRLATGVIVVGVCVDLIAGFLPMTAAYRSASLALYAFGGGILAVAIVMLFLNRKAS